MPWTIDDVDQHKKGLSDKQKAQWVAIANSVREKCLKDGGNEKDCDANAIRQANGAIMGNMEVIVNFDLQIAYTPSVIEWNKKEHIVVPVVMMVEGVHNGSRGPVYHNPDELGRIEASWNGIPVTISHPINEDNQFISANSPNVLEKYSVGTIFNTHLEDGKLKAEAWLDVQRLTAVSPETLDKVRKGEIIEVSVGIFNDEDEEEGDWNNEHYIAVAKNYRPDHLALLPGEVGACSITDGCGVRVNTSNEIDVKFNKEEKVMCEKCPEKVDLLIANTATHFDDSDRNWLLELDENQLDKLIPKRVRVNTETPEIKTPTVEDAWKIIQANAKNEDYINHLPEDLKGMYTEGMAVLKEQRDNLIKSIMDNTEKDVWMKEELEMMDTNVLKKVEKSVHKSDADAYNGGNYVAMGAHSVQNTEPSVMPLGAPGVEFE